MVPRAELAATLTELEPGTEYLVTLLSSAGELVGEPSDAFAVTTLVDVDTGSPAVDAELVKPQATPGEVQSLIVTLTSDSASAEEQADAAASDLPVAGVVVDDTQGLGAGNVRVDLSQGVSEADAALMIADIESDPRVESVTVDQRVFRTAFPNDPPDDTYWVGDSMWGLYGSYGIGVASSKTSMNGVWTTGQGDSTVVAVLDSGSTVHPDLDANYVAGYDFVANRTGYCRTAAVPNSDGDYVSTANYGALGWDSNPLDPGDWTTVNTLACNFASDSSWHGTHVAGTVAAVGNNGIGVIGVAPQAKVQPVRVLSYDGGYTSDIVAAITWASGGSVPGVTANPTPADVINMSLGGTGSCTTDWQTAIDEAVGRGTVVVVSAGNSAADAANFVPANCSNVITVAATDTAGNRSSFSNYGTAVEIAAPGSGIWSTMNSGTTTPGSAIYTSYSGTSMAAPHVAGVAALIKLTYPALTPAQILSRIQANVQAFPGGSTCTTSLCGSGLMNASAAVTTEPIPVAVSPTVGPSAGGTSTTITGYNFTGASSVTFGGTAAAVYTVDSSYAITATTPGTTAGAKDVSVTTPSGTRSLTSAFTFHDPPTLMSTSVALGTTSGGTALTLTGTNLSGASSVTFGGTAGTITGTSSTTVSVTTPAHAAGPVDIEVTTPGGTDTLAGAFTFVTPPSPPAPAPPSGGSTSSSSTESSGGGGGLNEITTISPSASGPPGSVIALAGWGLTTTRGVYFNEYPAASWRVVSDSHVEVTVPDIPPGVYVIHAVLAPAVGRASYWTGYHVLAAGSAPPSTATLPGTSPSPTPTSTSSAADLLGFRANSAALSAATKAKLNRMTTKVGDDGVTGTIVTFRDLRGTAESTRIARARARNIVSYLNSLGVNGQWTTVIEKGTTATLRRSAMVSMSADPGASVLESGDRVVSLIVRYAKGVRPTVDGRVRGANLVTGGLGAGMTLGPNLGLRMYRVDFANPVTLAQAEKAATQMSKDKGIEFAEPDRIVRATISAG